MYVFGECFCSGDIFYSQPRDATDNVSCVCAGGYDGSDRLNDFIRFDFGAYDLNLQVPQSSLIDDLRNLVNDETLSDITFIVEDQPVYAHKLMLMR